MDGQLLSDILSVSPTIKILEFQELLWLTDGALAMCAPHCRLIEELRLNQCNEITAEGVAQVLMRAGSRICSIHIIDLPQLGDNFALAVAQYCTQIRELILSAAAVTDVSVAVLATQCNHLRVLSLYECMSVTMPGVCALAEHCDELRYLHLPSTLQGQPLPCFKPDRPAAVYFGDNWRAVAPPKAPVS
jgi:Ran GTPase-activating protein (RanGAP) involved in mRNA processing and transport